MRNKKNDLDFHNRFNLKKFLRYHGERESEPVTSLEERVVRRSFDSDLFLLQASIPLSNWTAKG